MIRSDLALAALATAAVPGMRPVAVGALRTGEENPLHQSALVEDVTGRTWVVRSPLTPAAGAELERNDDLIRQLGKHLPFKVPAAAGYADLGRDGRAVVYPYVEGLALSLRHLPVGQGLASAVGRAIAAVHNMPRELFEEFSVPVFDAAQFRDRKLSELDRAAETGHVPNGLLARWEQALDAAALWQFVTVPTHGSLDGGSFLVAFSDPGDAASGRVVGLTGWERAQIADPAEDFARLVELSNPRAVDAVFDSYAMARSQRPDGYLLHRARLASEMRLLSGLAAAVGGGDEQFVRRRADELRKLDRLTAGDDSLIPRTALADPMVGVAPDEPETPEQENGGPVSGPVAGEQHEGELVGEGLVGEGLGEDALDGEGLATDGSAGESSAGPDAAPDDEPAFVVEPPADGAHLEPAHPTEEPVSAADVTAPIPLFRPVGASDAAPETGDGADPEAVSDQDAVETAVESDVATPGEPGDTTADLPETAEDTSADLPETAEETAADLPEEATVDGFQEAGNTTTGPSEGATTDEPDEAPAGEQDSAVSDQAQELADRAEEERLHTLYGMPDESDIDPSETGGR